jgi:hypothetical protein
MTAPNAICTFGTSGNCIFTGRKALKNSKAGAHK